MSQDSKNGLWVIEKGTTTMVIAEVVGTAILLFLGCMGSLGTMTTSIPTQLQMSMAFGMTVNFLIMMVGHISGAHFNPAVTIGAVIAGVKSLPTGALYIVAQFVGATIGYKVLMLVTPEELFNDGRPGSTGGFCVTALYPGVTLVQGILIECFCTACVLCTACATWDPRCAHLADSMSIKFGFCVVGISVAAAPATGCSMNPARSFGPAFWTGIWTDQWLYWVGPILGALLGTYTYQILFALKEKREDKHDGIEMEAVDTIPNHNGNLSISKEKCTALRETEKLLPESEGNRAEC